MPQQLVRVVAVFKVPFDSRPQRVADKMKLAGASMMRSLPPTYRFVGVGVDVASPQSPEAEQAKLAEWIDPATKQPLPRPKEAP